MLSHFLLGIALAMDCFAVSISTSLIVKKISLQQTLRQGLFFGSFQAGMTILGWFGTQNLAELLQNFDHWVAFGLLIFVGGKMLYESFENEEAKKIDPLQFKTLFLLSIATSIDAFAIGISLALLDEKIFIPALIIGITSFLFTISGIQLGKKIGTLIGNKAEIMGGIILIGIGLKVLIEHLKLF